MSRSMKYRTVMFLGFLLIGQRAAFSTSSQKLVLMPNSALWLVGDSTLHPFTSRTTQLQVSSSMDSQGPTEAVGAPSFDAILHRKALKTLDVVIAVTSLKSKESGLDKNMYRALKADQCPSISFHLASYEVVPSTHDENVLHATASGTLSIACQERPVTIETDLASAPETLRVQGHYTLLMTDYGVKPPSMMMGTIKVKNPVIIHFDLLLGFADQ